MILLILIQAAAQTPPDIAFEAHARIREVRIEQRGETSLEVRGGQGSVVRVDRPDSAGRNRLRNVDVTVHAEARVEDPRENVQAPETPRSN